MTPSDRASAPPRAARTGFDHHRADRLGGQCRGEQPGQFGQRLDPRPLPLLRLPEPGALQGAARRLGHAQQVCAFHVGYLMRRRPPHGEIAERADLGEQRKRGRRPDAQRRAERLGVREARARYRPVRQVHRSAVAHRARSWRVGIKRPGRSHRGHLRGGAVTRELLKALPVGGQDVDHHVCRADPLTHRGGNLFPNGTDGGGVGKRSAQFGSRPPGLRHLLLRPRAVPVLLCGHPARHLLGQDPAEEHDDSDVGLRHRHGGRGRQPEMSEVPVPGRRHVVGDRRERRPSQDHAEVTEPERRPHQDREEQ